jgi:DNA-binding NtrC family response regulator
MASLSRQTKPFQDTSKSSYAHRILIVDDEPAILFAYRKLIEKEGMCVDISSCLNGAIQHIRDRYYLAVIADMRLSGTDNNDGMEFLRIVRHEHPTTKMIIATGYGSLEIEAAARALGVSYYFEKPVQPLAIMGALKSFTLSLADPPG